MSPHLSDALHVLRMECRKMVASGQTFSPREIEAIAEFFTKAEAEAVRLEAVETAARARDVAERAVQTLGRVPIVDLDALEAAIADTKVVPFPLGGRRHEGAVL